MYHNLCINNTDRAVANASRSWFLALKPPVPLDPLARRIACPDLAEPLITPYVTIFENLVSRSFWTIAQHLSNTFASIDNRNIAVGVELLTLAPGVFRSIFDHSVCKPHSASTNSCFVAANIVHRTLSQRISQSNRPLRPLHARRQKPFSGLRISSIKGLAHSLLLSSNDDHVEPLPSPDVPPTFWDLVPFLCASGLARPSPPSSPYPPKTIRTTAGCLAGSGRIWPATDGVSQA